MRQRQPTADVPAVAPIVMRQRGETLAAIGFAVAACGLFALLDTATKYVVQTVPVLMALCVRYLVQAVVSSAWLMPTYGRAVWRMQQPRLLLLRGLLLVTSTILAIFSLRVMPVADFVGIIMVTPVVVTVLSATVFREVVGRWQWACVVLGFAGALFIIQPGGAQFSVSTLLPLGCMAAAVGYQLLSGHLGRNEHPAAVHFSSMWVGAIISAMLLPWGWVVIDSVFMWSLMVMMGLIGAISHYLLALAYQRAPATVVVPYIYTQVGFAVLFGWLVFADFPDHLSLAGIALVILSGIGNAWLLRGRAPSSV